MQEKMSSRNPLLRALGSATSRLWFPAALASARNFPRPLMHGGGRLLAAVYYRARPKYLRAARANLAIIRGLSPDDPEVRSLASAMVGSHFAAWWMWGSFISCWPMRSPATRPPGFCPVRRWRSASWPRAAM